MVKIDLPDNVALTERSKKFYDGTYSWDSVGFTDDKGVYRAFDCYDPLARAPTPMPCLSLGDEEEQALEVAGSEIEKEKVSRSKENGERGITPPSSPTRKSGEKEKEMEKVTPKRSSPKPKTFSPSELSDCPADISEWDVGQAKPEFDTIANSAQQQEEEEQKQKLITKGVAQKVKKTARKPASKAPKESVPKLVAALELGSSMKGERRRSSRLGGRLTCTDT